MGQPCGKGALQKDQRRYRAGQEGRGLEPGQRAKGGQTKCERAKPVNAMSIHFEPHGHGEEVGRKDIILRKKGDRGIVISERRERARNAESIVSNKL